MLDELKQCMSLNGSTEQTPEALSFRIADLCEMKDSVVSQVNDLICILEFLQHIFFPLLLLIFFIKYQKLVQNKTKKTKPKKTRVFLILTF